MMGSKRTDTPTPPGLALYRLDLVALVMVSMKASGNQFVNGLMSGAILAIAVGTVNGLSTYVFSGDTWTEKVESMFGGGSQ